MPLIDIFLYAVCAATIVIYAGPIIFLWMVVVAAWLLDPTFRAACRGK
jgi:hypothetical protein